MKILITGGLGFIGSNLLKLLSTKKEVKKIIIIDNFSKSSLKYINTICKYKYYSKSKDYKASNHKVTVIKADIMDYKLALKLTHNIDYIVHLAAESGIDASIDKPKESFNTNVNGTMNYLESARINKAKGFIFASSGAVFGTSKPPMKETYIRAPISPYGSSKLSIESFCETYSNVFNLNTTILRFSNAYGKYSLHKKSIITAFVKNIFNNKCISINGDGKHTRDYIFADDLCKAIYKAIIKCKGNNIFHISTGKETSINKLVDKMKYIFNNKSITLPKVINKKDRPGDIRFNSLSTSHTKKELKWANKTSIDLGLKKTIDWFLSNK
ncbi:MAG: NAD-dependent epimerase/dehydratase family protein [Gammaproteobacteria bacterium]|nr:NAD-dependent epimerase/dehydratase family protein [Gammaproteobacteria bacterium]MBT6733743.1 NAD-dependent epimerase/dehydratase family protein [Gammaproteobacteria bacterium]MBT7237163.1 NAD-dependent epimerase/dehydratase family protein [Gammaproteobacteria bacterium]